MRARQRPPDTVPTSGTAPISDIQIFGIRHHGPGSARSVCRSLESLQPDIILVEGPPEAEPILSLLTDEEMEPPVALLVYRPDRPSEAVFFPFAVFSPEWQALRWGLGRSVPVRLIDLPQAHRMAIEPVEANLPPGDGAGDGDSAPPASNPPTETLPTDSVPTETGDNDADDEESDGPNETPEDTDPREDPLGWLARAAGFEDGEAWWERMVEQRRDAGSAFEAILEAMEALREEFPWHRNPVEDRLEILREAWMRQSIRKAQSEGFERIAVICGAWHGPALNKLIPAGEDAALLRKLPQVKVQATWTPWSYDRLGFWSGYGAGIRSPGWYEHLWTATDCCHTRWLIRVAELLRAQDLDASSASIIEAVRLAETLASFRGHSNVGLQELNEAAQAVLCAGSELPMQLIGRKLIVGDRLGRIPAAAPAVPLQLDINQEVKRLRLVEQGSMDLDLRKPLDRDRSIFLHRLTVLGICWGQTERVSGARGSFHELWRIQWQPELSIRIIEAAVWGVTVAEAAGARARDLGSRSPDLRSLIELLQGVLKADLPDVVLHLVSLLQSEAALCSDESSLMDALPPLANIFRYSDVRKTDASSLGQVIEGMVTRIVIGLPGACSSLDDDAATTMIGRLRAVHAAILLLEDSEQRSLWTAVLRRVMDQPGLHGLVAGRCCRLLLDLQAMSVEDAATRLGLALSTASEPAQAAAWIDGLLRESGLVLLHDNRLWDVLDRWVVSAPAAGFPVMLPLLRRTFSTFSPAERRQLGERVRGTRSAVAGSNTEAFDHELAAKVLPLLTLILGLETPGQADSTGAAALTLLFPGHPERILAATVDGGDGRQQNGIP